MTTKKAIDLLEKGATLPQLADAIGTVCSDPATSFDAIMLGLKYPGFVAEQAAFALYRRSFRPLPADRNLLVTDRQAWVDWLAARGLAETPSRDEGQSEFLTCLIQAQERLSEVIRRYSAAVGLPAEATKPPRRRKIAPRTGTTTPGRARSRAVERHGSLKSYIRQVLASSGDKQMAVEDITEAVLKCGYRTRSRSLAKSIGIALAEMKTEAKAVKRSNA